MKKIQFRLIHSNGETSHAGASKCENTGISIGEIVDFSRDYKECGPSLVDRKCV